MNRNSVPPTDRSTMRKTHRAELSDGNLRRYPFSCHCDHLIRPFLLVILGFRSQAQNAVQVKTFGAHTVSELASQEGEFWWGLGVKHVFFLGTKCAAAKNYCPPRRNHFLSTQA